MGADVNVNLFIVVSETRPMDPRIVRPVHEEMKPYRKDMSSRRGGDALDSSKGYGDGHGQTPVKNLLKAPSSHT
jgi:hypothetical protein